MSEPLIAICSACGALRTTAANCAHCGTAQGGIKVAQRTDDAVWVCIECTFKCRMCGFRVPLNRLDMDGEVICARCSLEQAFDIKQWQTVFEEAHAVADLWGDRGRELESHLDSQYALLGKQNASMVFNGAGENAVNVMASPGAPLCENCKAPLPVTLDEAAKKSGRSSITCTCGATSSYEVPAAAREMGPLLSVIGSEHRTDRKDVKVDATESAISVRCPGCNAPLPANEDTKFVTCSYCHVQARIPDRTWFKISKKEHIAEPIWLLFKNPSKSRVGVTELKREFDAKQASISEMLAHRQAERLKSADAEEKRQLEYAAKEKARKESDIAEQLARDEQNRKRADAEKMWTRLGYVGTGLFLAAWGVVYVINAGKESAKHAGDSADTLGCSREHNDICKTDGDKFLAAKNYDAALDSYEKGCSYMWTEACQQADALCDSTSIPVRRRIKHFEDNCNHNELEACNAAGLIYMNEAGDGLAKDEAAAASLFEKACDGANPTGCKLLAQSCARVVSPSCPVVPDAGVDAGHKALPKH